MKRYNHIGTLTAVLAAVLILLAGCSKEGIKIQDRPLPPAGMGELTLGQLQLLGGETATAQARAGASSNLPEGSTLRLYAFAEGETNFGSSLATRTYTINATGAAVLDPGQEPLFLPKGKADIYLVGPVEHNTGTQAAPVMVEVASEWGIYPRIGADLIATYAQATIVAGNTNPLPPMTLEHKMARAQIVVETNPAAVYENLVVEEVKLYGQPTMGTFTLDNTGGTISSGQEPADYLFPSVAKDPTAEKYSATTVLIPQAEREVKVEITFECNQKNIEQGDNHPTLRYRQSGLITAPLAAGTATRFSTLPITPVEIKWRTQVVPWNEVRQGEIYVPGIVQLPPVTNGLVGHYDGRIPPEVINGILVWRDCSPQQNHGKLLTGTTWDVESGSYIGPVELIKESAAYLYSSQNGMTVEMIWKRPGTYNDISIFRIGRPSDPDEKKTLLTSWKPAGAKYCEWAEGTFRKNYLWGASTEKEDVKNFAYWAWAKGGHDKVSGYYNQGYKNGIPQSTGYSTTKNPLAGENLIAFGHVGWQLKAVRIYNRQLTDDEIRLNYAFDQRYNNAGLPIIKYNPQPPTPDQIIEINGLKWTKGNLVLRDALNCKVGAPSDNGLYFQYGGLVGYKAGIAGDGTGIPNATANPNYSFWNGTSSYSDEEVAVKPVAYKKQGIWPEHEDAESGGFGYYYFNTLDTKYADFQGKPGDNDPTNGIGDPCAYYLGGDWRLPKYDELSSITGSDSERPVDFSATEITGRWTDAGPESAKGAWFGPNSRTGNPTTNTDLFIPASGYRDPMLKGVFYNVESFAILWSSSVFSGSNAFNVYIRKSGVNPRFDMNRRCGLPVRCVSDK